MDLKLFCQIVNERRLRCRHPQQRGCLRVPQRRLGHFILKEAHKWLALHRAEMSNIIGADLNLSEIELPSNVACKETFNRLLSQNALW